MTSDLDSVNGAYQEESLLDYEPEESNLDIDFDFLH